MMHIDKLIVIALMTIIPFRGMGQFVQKVAFPGHTTFHNLDPVGNAELGAILAAIQKRKAIITDMNKLIGEITAEEKVLLNKKYGKSPHDGQSGFYAKIGGTVSLKAAQDFLASEFSGGKYMTQNKREYMDHMGLDQFIIPFLLVLDTERITAANRQKIYRLRSDVIRQYSKNDKEIRNMMLLAAAFYAVKNGEGGLLEMINELLISL